MRRIYLVLTVAAIIGGDVGERQRLAGHGPELACVSPAAIATASRTVALLEAP